MPQSLTGPLYDREAKLAEVKAISDSDLLTRSRQVLVDDRDELAYGQFIVCAAEGDKPCHCVAGAALQACDLYVASIPTMPGYVSIPIEYTAAEANVLERLAPLLEPVFDETLIRAAMHARNAEEHAFADYEESVTWSQLLCPAEADRSGQNPAALVFTYNDVVLFQLGKAEGKAEAIKLYDRAIIRLQEASA